MNLFFNRSQHVGVFRKVCFSIFIFLLSDLWVARVFIFILIKLISITWSFFGVFFENLIFKETFPGLFFMWNILVIMFLSLVKLPQLWPSLHISTQNVYPTLTVYYCTLNNIYICTNMHMYSIYILYIWHLTWQEGRTWFSSKYQPF